VEETTEENAKEARLIFRRFFEVFSRDNLKQLILGLSQRWQKINVSCPHILLNNFFI